MQLQGLLMTDLLFTDSNRELINQVARVRKITFEQAANQLFSEGLEKRVGRITPKISSSVTEFRRMK